jgi:integrase
LRREFGSRVLESGSSLVKARDLLGHANISQTSTYLQSTAKSLGLAIEKKEQYEQQLAEAQRDVALPGGNIRGFLPGKPSVL